MPSKTIYPAPSRNDQARPLPELVVSWLPGKEAQIGLRTPRSHSVGSVPGHHHVIDLWYGQAPTMTTIAQLLVKKLAERDDVVISVKEQSTSDAEAEVLASIGRDVLDAVSGSSAEVGISWWTDLDRQGWNALVRYARQARDKAFGRDE